MCIATASEPATASVSSSPCTEILEVAVECGTSHNACCLHAGATVQQQLHNFDMVVSSGLHQRHYSVLRGHNFRQCSRQRPLESRDLQTRRSVHCKTSTTRHATPRLAVTALATSSRARWPCVDWTRLRPHSALGLHVSAMVQQQPRHDHVAVSRRLYQRRIATLRCHDPQRRSQLTPITPCGLQTRRSEPATPRHA